MTTVQNDQQFKTRLGALSFTQQRRVGAMFVERVVDLADNARVRTAIAVAGNPEASSMEVDDAYKAARGLAVETYTICGEDADWLRQAAHFVAAAVAACLVPEHQTAQCRQAAWNAAVNARMARTCEHIARGETQDNRESEAQYGILEQFLATI
jgi:hypothetical protein